MILAGPIEDGESGSNDEEKNEKKKPFTAASQEAPRKVVAGVFQQVEAEFAPERCVTARLVFAARQSRQGKKHTPNDNESFIRTMRG